MTFLYTTYEAKMIGKNFARFSLDSISDSDLSSIVSVHLLSIYCNLFLKIFPNWFYACIKHESEIHISAINSKSLDSNEIRFLIEPSSMIKAPTKID